MSSLFAVMISLKHTFVLLSIAPILAFGLTYRSSPRWTRVVATFIASTAVVGTLLFSRFVVRAFEIPNYVAGSLQTLKVWAVVFDRTPYSYYNVEQFSATGVVFVIVSIAGIILCLVMGLLHRDRAAALISLTILPLSAILAPQMKYERGALFQLVFYISALAYLIDQLCSWLGRTSNGRKWSPASITIILTLILAGDGIVRVILAYRAEIALTPLRAQTLKSSRFAARDWFEHHIPAGARICEPIHSNLWIYDLGYHFNSRLLGFPYLDHDAMADFSPPSKAVVEENCDIVVWNNYISEFFFGMFDRHALPDQRNRWERFLTDDLNSYQRVRFEGPVRVYFVRSFDVFIVNPAIIRNL